jgi:glycosyltransferase involved in cell wall biosynthesis
LDKPESIETNRADRGEALLRILLLVNLPWEGRLGAIKVFMELAQAWRAAGHCVDIFSMDQAFPKRTRSAPMAALRQLLFNHKAAAFIRSNAGRYDVVDALVGSLSASKAKLEFRGLLVARSVGLYRLYDRFERNASKRWPDAGGKLVGKVYYTLIAGWLRRASDASICYADVINVPNEDEAGCLRTEISPRLSITVHGYGLPEERRHAFAQAAATVDVRRASRTISFVGAWGPRKGAKDWGRIVRLVWAQIPEARFLFLGTLTDDANVFRDLGFSESKLVRIVPEYQPDDLPGLLSASVAGGFPTYAEGFGFALLEQLASGIPTVAYDSPGPRSILTPDLLELLVPAGDIEKFSAALVRILQMDAASYERLTRQSRETADRFNWGAIARDTAQSYRRKIAGGQ